MGADDQNVEAGITDAGSGGPSAADIQAKGRSRSMV